MVIRLYFVPLKHNAAGKTQLCMNEWLPLSDLSVTTHIPSSFFGALSTVTQREQHQDDVRFFFFWYADSRTVGISGKYCGISEEV